MLNVAWVNNEAELIELTDAVERLAPTKENLMDKADKALKMYVGNLPYELTEAELQSAFEAWDFRVIEAKIIIDHDTQR